MPEGRLERTREVYKDNLPDPELVDYPCDYCKNLIKVRKATVANSIKNFCSHKCMIFYHDSE